MPLVKQHLCPECGRYMRQDQAMCDNCARRTGSKTKGLINTLYDKKCELCGATRSKTVYFKNSAGNLDSLKRGSQHEEIILCFDCYSRESGKNFYHTESPTYATAKEALSAKALREWAEALFYRDNEAAGAAIKRYEELY